MWPEELRAITHTQSYSNRYVVRMRSKEIYNSVMLSLTSTVLPRHSGTCPQVHRSMKNQHSFIDIYDVNNKGRFFSVPDFFPIVDGTLNIDKSLNQLAQPQVVKILSILVS